MQSSSSPIATSKRAELNLLLLGLDAAGKTELVSLLTHTERIDFTPTVGCRSDRVQLPGPPAATLRLTELGGARDVRDIWHHYYPEAHGTIFVVDSCDWARLPLVRELLGNLMLRTQLSGKPMLVVCAKQDVPGAWDVLDCCAELDVERLANQSRTPCFVAALGHNDAVDFEAGLQWLVQTVRRNMRRIRNQNEYFATCSTDRRPPLKSSRSLTPSRRRATATKRALREDPLQPMGVEPTEPNLRRPKSAPSARDQRRQRRVAPANCPATVASDVSMPAASTTTVDS